MAVKASNFKNWCTENISPQSWTRICLKCLDQVRDAGMTLKQMEELDPDIDLPPELLTSLNEALEELYEMSVDESLLIRY
ncbi:hypothetical protein [Marinoscillum furvescens]|uniref:Uncharacterized protein n=1 Tax=Marinoscillum furvescens DSM 4134 TaxID=1122208 RepID=A0A3D9L926_MARFU|nr:hypothetical protein [Marinoscillum furvescens]REE02176.1 hypothetical protein C7460_102200 [Marinoscillum furvescens DSM 4134]